MSENVIVTGIEVSFDEVFALVFKVLVSSVVIGTLIGV